jgi:hypothetical protein
MIEAGDGRKSFYKELCDGEKNSAEVLLVGQIEITNNGSSAAGPAHLSSHKHEKNGDSGNGNGDKHGAEFVRARGARLSRAEVLKQESGALQLRLRMDPEYDLYLKDHAFDGMPVLPMAVASELMAETAQFMYPDYRLARLENLDIPSGIMFEQGARDLYLNLKELSHDGDEIKADLSLCVTPNAARKNFIAQAVLQKTSIELDAGEKFLAKYEKSVFLDEESEPPTATEAYTSWLFHGPLMQGISKIESMGRTGIQGQLDLIPISECLKDSTEPWLIDPILLDSAMQFAGIWARHYMGLTALPTGFKKLHISERLDGKKFKAIVNIPEETKNGQLHCDLAVYNEEGRLIILMEGLGGVGSKALNRLGAVPKALRSR